MDYVLAQVNIGRLLAPIDSPLIADFVGALDPVNAVADAAPGFVWRLQTEDGDATAVRGFEQDGVGAAAASSSTCPSGSRSRRWPLTSTARARRDTAAAAGVVRADDATRYLALWWIPRGHIPTVGEAEDRLEHLRAHGPTPYAFTLKQHFPPSGGDGAREAIRSPEDWACPV